MHIEEIEPQTLRDVAGAELRNLRFRMTQLWERYYVDGGEGVGDLSREKFLVKYKVLRQEMARRDIETQSVTQLDRALLKRAMGSLDASELGEVVVVESYIAVGGGFVRDPRSAADLDVVIRAPEESRDEGLELKVGRVLHGQVDRDCHFIYAPAGPHSSYVPVFDLVLRPRPDTKVVEVQESGVEKKRPGREQAGGEERQAYYAGLEDWDDELRAGNEALQGALADGSVLDVGCGSGKLLKILAGKGRKVKGLDRDEVACKLCRDKGVPVEKVDIEEAGLPEDLESWDNVIFVHTLEHLADPKKALGQAENVAKKKVLVVAPLGERQDPGHKQTWKSLPQLEAVLPDGWKARQLEPGNSAIAVWDKRPVQKGAVVPFGPYIPPKPTMAGLTEAFSVADLKGWLEGKYPLDAEEKLNGLRMVLQKKGDRVSVKTEGNVDRTKALPEVAAALQKVPGDVILDASVGIERKGRALPRIRLMTLMADKPELEEGDVVMVTVFDLPYWEKDLHEEPLTARRKSLEELYSKHLKSSPHFSLTSFNVVKDEAALVAAFKRLAKLPQSEGVVIKTLDGQWDPDGSADSWAKIKRELEVKVIVLAVQDTKGGRTFTGGLDPGETDYTNLREYGGKKYVELGKTFASKLEAKPGDIITCGVEEVIPQGEKLVWLGARPLDVDKDRREPYGAGQVESMAERANLLQKRTLPGVYLVQPHGELIATGEKNLIVKIKPLAEEYVRKDVFLVEDKHVLGVIQLGKPEEIDQEKFRALAEEHRISEAEADRWGFSKEPKLLAYKVKVQELFPEPIGYDPPPGAQTVIQEVRIGKAKQQEHGTVDFEEGDKGDGILQLHIMGLSDEEAQKLKDARSRVAVARADIPRLRQALISTIGEHAAHLDFRLRRGTEKNWQGGEIFVGNIGGLDKLPAFLEGKRTLRAPWKQPHVGEGGTGEQTVEGPLDWMESGSSGAELFEPGSAGATANEWGAMVRFDKYRWEMYLADEHAKKLRFTGGRYLDGDYLFSYVPVAEGQRVWMARRLADDDHEQVQKGDLEFRITKVDPKQHIVGGIVYEPRSVDTQGDWSDKTEIEQAMYHFMERYAKDSKRIKVMHKGEFRYFPVLESFQPEVDTKKGGETIKAGSWWLMVKVTDPDIWDLVEKKKLTGFSMGGRATGKMTIPPWEPRESEK